MTLRLVEPPEERRPEPPRRGHLRLVVDRSREPDSSPEPPQQPPAAA